MMSIDVAISLRIAGYICFLLTPFVVLFFRGLSKTYTIVLVKYILSIAIMCFFIIAPLLNLDYQLGHIVETLDRDGDGAISPDEEATWTSKEIQAWDEFITDGARNVFGFLVFPIFSLVYTALVFSIIYVIYGLISHYRKKKLILGKFSDLKIGMKIKFVSIPKDDLQEFEKTNDDFTTRIFQKLIDQAEIVTISKIDQYGYPWFEYVLLNESEEEETHSIAVMSDDGWVRV